MRDTLRVRDFTVAKDETGSDLLAHSISRRLIEAIAILVTLRDTRREAIRLVACGKRN